MKIMIFLILFSLNTYLNTANDAGTFNDNKCGLITGPIIDSSCDFETVNQAVINHYIPILSNLTSRAFFRYFRVDLERPCPFWEDEGVCSMKGCSVGKL